ARLIARACLAFELGSVWAESHAATNPRDEQQIWPTAETLVRVKYAVLGGLFLEADVGVGVPVLRPRYFFEPDQVLYEVPAVAARRLDEIDPPRERQYLLGIALRVASDARHSLARRREVPIGDSRELGRQMAFADGAPLAEQLLDEKRARAVLAAFLESMPKD